MNALKVENFRIANPSAELPVYRELAPQEAFSLSDRLIRKAEIPSGPEAEMMNALTELARPVRGVDLEASEVPLQVLFSRCGIVPLPELYVQWRMFREIDVFPTTELERCFYDVWYPKADDIELFDDSMDWLILVSHFGMVSMLHLSAKK